jgi:hypothetical protein
LNHLRAQRLEELVEKKANRVNLQSPVPGASFGPSSNPPAEPKQAPAQPRKARGVRADGRGQLSVVRGSENKKGKALKKRLRRKVKERGVQRRQAAAADGGEQIGEIEGGEEEEEIEAGEEGEVEEGEEFEWEEGQGGSGDEAAVEGGGRGEFQKAGSGSSAELRIGNQERGQSSSARSVNVPSELSGPGVKGPSVRSTPVSGGFGARGSNMLGGNSGMGNGVLGPGSSALGDAVPAPDKSRPVNGPSSSSQSFGGSVQPSVNGVGPAEGVQKRSEASSGVARGGSSVLALQSGGEDLQVVEGEGEEDEEEEEGELIMVPDTDEALDPTVLASLPASVQIELMQQMRERRVAQNREKFRSASFKGIESRSCLENHFFLAVHATASKIVCCSR